MNSYICSKINDCDGKHIEKPNEIPNILQNTEFNEHQFKTPFCNIKNTLIICCILSYIVYRYESNYIFKFLKNWGLDYIIMDIEDILCGLFYTDEFLIISFKGTSSLKETLSDLDFSQVDDKYNIPGKIHKGFHDLLLKNNTCDKIQEKVLNILSSHKTIYITGHSLGGALATIFYTYLKSSSSITTSLELITFGCPRTGDIDFCKAIDNDGNIKHRIVNGSDIITKVPLPLLWSYRHPKEKTVIGHNCFPISFLDHDINGYYENLLKFIS